MLKARKDLAQAAFLTHVLAETDPDALRDAFEDAQGRGPAWARRIAASLARLPDSQAVLEGL